MCQYTSITHTKNDTERFSSEEEHQPAIEALPKNLNAVKKSFPDDNQSTGNSLYKR